MLSQKMAKKSYDRFFVHSSAFEASSNKAEGIFQQPILLAVEKYTKTRLITMRLQPNYIEVLLL